MLAYLSIVMSWLGAIIDIMQKGTWFKRQSICHVVVSSEVCGLFVYFILSLNIFFKKFIFSSLKVCLSRGFQYQFLDLNPWDLGPQNTSGGTPKGPKCLWA